MKITFLGLGVMGDAIAGHIHAAGYETTVYNRTSAKAKAWIAARDKGAGKDLAKQADQVSDAVRAADIVLMCVGNDDDVRALCYGADGIIANMQPHALLVDHTTASARLAEELNKACAQSNIGFIDAPVSGGEEGAKKGQLAVMCGGKDNHIKRAQPIFERYAKTIAHIGDVGAGQTTKMVNQICIAGLLQSLAEALNFSERAGLDTERVLEVISKGAAQSWQMENRGATMIRDAYDHGFAIEWMRKDLGLCLDEAERIGARLPVTALVDQFYHQLMLEGGARWDTSALMKLLNNN